MVVKLIYDWVKTRPMVEGLLIIVLVYVSALMSRWLLLSLLKMTYLRNEKLKVT